MSLGVVGRVQGGQRKANGERFLGPLVSAWSLGDTAQTPCVRRLPHSPREVVVLLSLSTCRGSLVP